MADRADDRYALAVMLCFYCTRTYSGNSLLYDRLVGILLGSCLVTTERS